MSRPTTIYHATTPKKAALYRQTGHIIGPVRGFDTLIGAMAWALSIEGRRSVILAVEATSSDVVHKLPDHHNQFGTAWWIDENVKNWVCVFSGARPFHGEP